MNSNSLRKPLIERDEEEGQSNPKTERHHKDVPFTVLFILFLCGIFAISIKAFVSGRSNFFSQYGAGVIEKRIQALNVDAHVLIYVTIFGLGLAMLWVDCLRKYARILIMISATVGVGFLLFCGSYLIVVGARSSNESLIGWGVALLMSGISTGLGFFFVRHKLQLTAAFLSEACKALQSNASLFVIILPALVVLFLGFAALWISTAYYLYAVPGSAPGSFDKGIRWLMLYQVFGFFWVSAFLSSLAQVVIAGTVAEWYFHQGSQTGIPSFRYLKYAITYSFGSVAFGSLIVAALQFVQYLLNQFERAEQKYHRSKALKYAVSALRAVLALSEGAVRYANKWTFVWMAMHGDGFLDSARKVFGLMSRSGLAAVTMDMASTFVLFVGKTLGVASCVLAMVLTLEAHGSSAGQVSSVHAVSLLCAAVIGFTIFHIISHAVGVSIDTLFVCYMFDSEQGRHPFVADELHDMVQNCRRKRLPVGQQTTELASP